MDDNVEFFIKKFNVSRETIDKLKIYKDFLILSNKKLNLIGKTTENSIYSRHFLDSAQIYNIINKKLDIVDLGSGAGFPGLIIKLLMEDEKIDGKVILIEKSNKKSNFLLNISNLLNLKIKIYSKKLEDYNFNNQSSVVSRAFKSTLSTLDLLFKNISKIEEIVLLKGKTYQQEIDDAKKKYTFNIEKFKSITSDESYILKITDVKLYTT
jgi:16S rRNA (guanine527-N7)-methyltransferase